MTSAAEDHLRALESQRCRALVGGKLEELAELLSPQLVHVHASGRVENFDQYLQFVRERIEFLAIQRSQLDVRVYAAGFALMTGLQSSSMRLRPADGQVKQLDARVMQLWVLEAQAWKLRAFQATAVPNIASEVVKP